MEPAVQPAVRADDLYKTYPAPKGRTVEAVHGVSFDVAPGEIFGILGPNGAGKTSLLRMLGTIITPTAGRVWLRGEPAELHPESARGSIGFLSGNTRLYGRLTVAETLRYFGRLYGLEDDVIAARTNALSAQLDMDDFLHRRCATLSTGQTQRASIARVLLHEPAVLILDEPTLGLDILSSSTILGFIREAKARGQCVIFSTHYMTEAELLCDRIALLHRGEVRALGSQAELYAGTGTTNLHDAFLACINEPEVAAT